VQARAGSPFCGVLDALGPPCLTANVSFTMKSRASVLFAAAILLGFGMQCPSSHAQGVAAGITTNFAKDATLTPEQVQTVLELARECGLAEPTEVTTRRTHPLNRRFVVVRGKDHTDGRRSFYEQVDVWFSQWEKAVSDGTDVKKRGEFRVVPPYVVKTQFATFEVGGRTVTVQMADDTISLEVADRILSAFATKKIRFERSPLVDMDKPTFRQPTWFGYDQRTKEYIMYFGSIWSCEARCKLIGGEVVVTSGPTDVVY
jgi:hypothetical protein